MTYHNRLLTTPLYINSMESPFWSLVAADTAFKLGERCPHRNYLNKNVDCIVKNGDALSMIASMNERLEKLEKTT